MNTTQEHEREWERLCRKVETLSPRTLHDPATYELVSFYRSEAMTHQDIADELGRMGIRTSETSIRRVLKKPRKEVAE